ncbi:MAG TPA: AAA family ATPase [Thermoanaerobaculia bacterium]|nr:AAA family ATPase [Thermoanaerobaculia bacterium]
MHTLPNIALYGASGSGKSVIARHFVERYGYQRLSPGDICRQITRLAFGTEGKTTLNKVNDALRSIDHFVWINACLRQAKEDVPIVFDSMRFLPDWEFFRGKEYLLLKVEAPLGLRSQRLLARGQEFVLGVDDSHAGETELEGQPFDKVVVNMFADNAELTASIDDWMVSLAAG